MKALQDTISFIKEKYVLLLLFSIPFILAFLIPVFASTPTYLSMGAVFIRTGSIPDVNYFDMAVTLFAYLISLFIIADTIVNINIIIKTRRTRTKITQEILGGMGKYAVNLFLIYVFLSLLIFTLQLLTYLLPAQSILFPILVFVVTMPFLFFPPAMVIDNLKVWKAIRSSLDMLFRRPMEVTAWLLIGFFFLVLSEIVLFILPYPFGPYFVLFFNSLVLLPFLIVFQTNIYMEKYPLAK